VQTLEVTGKVSCMLLLERRRKKMMEVAMKSSSMFYRRECRPRNECGGEYQKGILVSIGVYRLELCALTGRAARRRL